MSICRVSHQKKKKKDLKKLLNVYPKLIYDLPGLCTITHHDMKLISNEVRPIRQPAYRTSPIEREIMKTGVDFLLHQNLAEPSISPWSSPCLLTPKSDGSIWFCTDYRQVNKVSVRVSYPLPLIEDLLDRGGKCPICNHHWLAKKFIKNPSQKQIRVYPLS